MPNSHIIVRAPNIWKARKLVREKHNCKIKLLNSLADGDWSFFEFLLLQPENDPTKSVQTNSGSAYSADATSV